MKTSLFPAASLAIAITVISFASSAVQDPIEKRPGTDEAAAVEQANTQIDAVYKQLMGKLDADGQKALKEAQRSWIKWRDDQALLIARIGGAVGGSALRVDYLTAQAKLIRQRTEVLREYLQHSGGNYRKTRLRLTRRCGRRPYHETISALKVRELINREGRRAR